MLSVNRKLPGTAVHVSPFTCDIAYAYNYNPISRRTFLTSCLHCVSRFQSSYAFLSVLNNPAVNTIALDWCVCCNSRGNSLLTGKSPGHSDGSDTFQNVGIFLLLPRTFYSVTSDSKNTEIKFQTYKIYFYLSAFYGCEIWFLILNVNKG
jgi:hypothetical protein